MDKTLNDLYKAVVAIGNTVASAKENIEQKINAINFDTILNSITKIQTGYTTIQNSVVLTVVTTNSSVTNIQAGSNATGAAAKGPEKMGPLQALAFAGMNAKHINDIYKLGENLVQVGKKSYAAGKAFASFAKNLDIGAKLSNAAKAIKLFITQGRLASTMTKVWSGVQAVFNVIMSANPTVLIVLAIVALVALVVVAIKHFDKWGAALLTFMGPLGWVINAFKIFYDNWESIQKAFKTDGILGGLKRIGVVLLDVLLKPLQQILELIGELPLKGRFATSGAESIKNLRTKLGVVTEGEKENTAKTTDDAHNPKKADALATNGFSQLSTPYGLPVSGRALKFSIPKIPNADVASTIKNNEGAVTSAVPNISIQAGIANNVVNRNPIISKNQSGVANNNIAAVGNLATNDIAAGGAKNTRISIDFKNLIGVLNIHTNAFNESINSMEEQITDALIRVLGSAQATAG